jgi:DNA modification methylase
MIIEKKKISDLIPAPYNPRQSTAKQEKHLKESLEKFGLVEPIIFNKQTGWIVGGHFRVRELIKLGVKEVECVIVDLNEEDEMELNIRLNANTGGWDWDTLANDWEVVDLEAWGLEIPQFDTVEKLEASEDDYEVPEGGMETDIVIGDLFEIGEHRLLCGDSTDSDAVARLMNGEKADMVFTDPPYGYKYESNYQEKHKELLNDDKILNFIPNAYLFTKENTAFYVFCGWQTVKQWILEIENSGLNLKNIIVWKKNNWSMGDLKGAYAGQYEIILFAHKGRIELKEGRGQDVWEFNRVPPKEHPTMKPIELIIKALKDVTNVKNLVLDLFLGSGSTMVAAHQLKRKCYGMELDPKYCQVIIDRMRKLDSSLIIKRNGVELKTS